METWHRQALVSGMGLYKGVTYKPCKEDEEDYRQTSSGDSKQHSHYTDEIMVSSTAGTRLSQAQARQKSQHEWKQERRAQNLSTS